MKHYKPLVFILLVLLSFSCKKKKSSSEIIVEYPIVFLNNLEVDLDTVPLDQFIVRESYDFPTNLDDELKKHGTNKQSIKSAVLLSLRLQELDYAYADSTKYFNFKDLKEIYLDIKESAVGQELIAQKTFIPDVRNNIINMDIIGSELKSYLQKETFRMVFKYRKRRQIHQEIPFTIVGKFKIVADPVK